MLALAPPSIAVVSFDYRCATPIPHVVTDRPGSSPHRSSSKQASNVRRQQTASIEIPIASDAPHRHTSRGFLLWRFAYAGPRCPPRHHHGAGIRKPSQERSVRNGRLGNIGTRLLSCSLDEPAIASAESIRRGLCRARRPCLESLQCRTMIEGSSDFFGDYRPTHDVCDTCAHQGVSADFFGRFRRQHDRQMGGSRVQRGRQIER
jgi:hypothetical protein